MRNRFLVQESADPDAGAWPTVARCDLGSVAVSVARALRDGWDQSHRVYDRRERAECIVFPALEPAPY